MNKGMKKRKYINMVGAERKIKEPLLEKQYILGASGYGMNLPFNLPD